MASDSHASRPDPAGGLFDFKAMTPNAVSLRDAPTPAEIIVLTGEPIGEPVARYGPFVMNTEAELRQAFSDFERGRFGVPAD